MVNLRIHRTLTPPGSGGRRPTQAEELADACRAAPGMWMSVKKRSKTPAYRLVRMCKALGLETRIHPAHGSRKYTYVVYAMEPAD